MIANPKDSGTHEIRTGKKQWNLSFFLFVYLKLDTGRNIYRSKQQKRD